MKQEKQLMVPLETKIVSMYVKSLLRKSRTYSFIQIVKEAITHGPFTLIWSVVIDFQYNRVENGQGGIFWKDTKGVIRICKSKDRQHNGQKKKDKRTNNDLQNNTQKTTDRATRTPLKTGGELRWSGRVSSSCSTSGTWCVTLVRNPVISLEWGKDRDVLTTSRTYPWSFVTDIPWRLTTVLVMITGNTVIIQY